jgi:hypothetical protein
VVETEVELQSIQMDEGLEIEEPFVESHAYCWEKFEKKMCFKPEVEEISMLFLHKNLENSINYLCFTFCFYRT